MGIDQLEFLVQLTPLLLKCSSSIITSIVLYYCYCYDYDYSMLGNGKIQTCVR